MTVLDDLVAGLKQGRTLPGFDEAASLSGQVPMAGTCQLARNVYDRAALEAAPVTVEAIAQDHGYALALLLADG